MMDLIRLCSVSGGFALSDCRTLDYVVFDALFHTVINGKQGESHKKATYLAYGSENH